MFTDRNECVDSAGICGNGTCRNRIGGFECLCSPGFEPGADNTCQGIKRFSEKLGSMLQKYFQFYKNSIYLLQILMSAVGHRTIVLSGA